MLLEGRGAEGPATPDGAMDRTGPPPLVFDGQLDSCADCRPVGLDADQPQAQPIVSVTGILEESQRMTVSWCRAADFSDDFLIAVIVQIGERDAMPLVQLAGA